MSEPRKENGWRASLKYEYVFQRAQDLAATPNPRILDYGIGLGELIFMGRDRNVDVHGVDRPGMRRVTAPKVIARTAAFRLTTTALREIHRVLKPGGAFLAFFPDNTVFGLRAHRPVFRSLADAVSETLAPLSRRLPQNGLGLRQRRQDRGGMGGLGLMAD